MYKEQLNYLTVNIMNENRLKLFRYIMRKDEYELIQMQ